MNILINLATRARGLKFMDLMSKVKDLTKSQSVIILVKADYDDVTMNQPAVRGFIYRFNEGLIKIHKTLGNRISKVEAINRDIHVIKGWDVLVNLSDDMMPRPNWDITMIERIRSTWNDTDFFAHFNDGHVGEALCTLSIIGKKYYDRDGYVYHPGYKSFSCDAEAMYVAQMRGKHKYFSDVLFSHNHPAYTKEPNDSLYKENSKHSAHDTAFYYERLNRYFEVPEVERCCVPFKQYMTV